MAATFAAYYMNKQNYTLNKRDALALERTVMANERTALSYLRTSAAIIVSGFSVYKFLPEVPNSTFLGAFLLLNGIGVLGYGYLRYHRVKIHINQYNTQLPS